MVKIESSKVEMVRLDDEPEQSNWKTVKEPSPRGVHHSTSSFPKNSPQKNPQWFAGRWAFLVYGFLLASVLFSIGDDTDDRSDTFLGTDTSNSGTENLTGNNGLGTSSVTSQSADNLLFSVQDLPTGWMAGSDGSQESAENGAAEGYQRTFVRATQFGGGESIDTVAWRFNSTDNAEQWFQNEKERAEQKYSTENWDKGDGAIYYEISSDYRHLIMVKGNIGWEASQGVSGAVYSVGMTNIANLLIEQFSAS